MYVYGLVYAAIVLLLCAYIFIWWLLCPGSVFSELLSTNQDQNSFIYNVHLYTIYKNLYLDADKEYYSSLWLLERIGAFIESKYTVML